MNISRFGKIDLSECKYVPSDYDSRRGRRVSAGDVLFNNTNSPELIGKTAYVSGDGVGDAFSNHMTRIVPHECVDGRFFAYQLHFFWMCGYFLHRCVKHVNEASISSSELAAHVPFLLAPFAEQRRIVAKIEELFSELDASAESLTRARAQLKTYRQALLKAAFEGKLTADWRAKNASRRTTIDSQLSTLKQARERWYEIEDDDARKRRAEWERTGRKGPAPARPERFRQPAPVSAEELDSLPKLPALWSYIRLSGIACVGSGMSVSKDRILEDPVEVPYLRVANVQRGQIDLGHIRTMKVERSQLPSLALRPNDVLFNEGGDRDKLGRGWVWGGAIAPCITQNHVFRATLFRPKEAAAKLLSHWGNSEGRDYFDKGGKQTTNLASINKAVLSALPVPLIPDAEADLLYSRLEAAFSTLDKNLSEMDAALSAIRVLRQSILKRAFSGRLVPQDPSDEPAATLLARLREASGTAPRKTRRKAVA
jgi:type I restriction enzyme, S subunit